MVTHHRNTTDTSPGRDRIAKCIEFNGCEKQKPPKKAALFCDSAGTRTQGPYIKSVLLYQLSYRISKLARLAMLYRCNRDAKVRDVL